MCPFVISSPVVSRSEYQPLLVGSTFDSSVLVYEEVMWGNLKQMEMGLIWWERQVVRCRRMGFGDK